MRHLAAVARRRRIRETGSCRLKTWELIGCIYQNKVLSAGTRRRPQLLAAFWYQNGDACIASLQ